VNLDETLLQRCSTNLVLTIDETDSFGKLYATWFIDPYGDRLIRQGPYIGRLLRFLKSSSLESPSAIPSTSISTTMRTQRNHRTRLSSDRGHEIPVIDGLPHEFHNTAQQTPQYVYGLFKNVQIPTGTADLDIVAFLELLNELRNLPVSISDPVRQVPGLAESKGSASLSTSPSIRVVSPTVSPPYFMRTKH
jgi:hypothetical protein